MVQYEFYFSKMCLYDKMKYKRANMYFTQKKVRYKEK